MATSKSKDGGANIRYDEFIKQVRPDASKAEPVVVLHGYIGESGSDDKIRLYADESLAEFADILKTDILYAVPDQDNPLGGSRLWIKQNAEVNHTDANAYAQGDMYNSYMGTMYDGGAAGMAGAVGPTGPAAAILTQNVICRNTVFVCPTPVSRLVICNQITRQANCLLTRNIQCQLTRGGCPQPSWVDACPSALGCTIQHSIACATDITRTIRTAGVNPGGFADAYGSDYAGGDMYNDYMGNTYDGGAANMAGAAATAACTIPVSFNCPASRTICPTPQSRLIICNQITRQANCLITRTPGCQVLTRGGCPQPSWVDACPSALGCTFNCVTDITRYKTVTVNPAGGFADAYGSDYAGGDMYNDYMQNSYDGGAANMAGGGVQTLTAACLQPIYTRNLNCPTVNIRCPRTYFGVCPITYRAGCPVTCVNRTFAPVITRICPSAADGCPSGWCPDTLQTRDIQGGGVQGGGFADAYGADYAGGDMYNDYMANDYSGDANMAGAAAAAPMITVAPVACPNTLQGCLTRFQPQCRTLPNICRTMQPTILVCCQPTVFPASRCCVTVATRCPVTICTLSPVICQRTRICDIGIG